MMQAATAGANVFDSAENPGLTVLPYLAEIIIARALFSLSFRLEDPRVVRVSCLCILGAAWDFPYAAKRMRREFLKRKNFVATVRFTRAAGNASNIKLNGTASV